MSEIIKKINSNIQIMFGGPQASVTACNTMVAFPWIDLISIGEAENTIVKIINAFEGKIKFSDVPGIVYRKNNKIIQNKELDLIENLDNLPLLDYSLVPYFEKLDTASIEGGRGCPFGCIYCSSKSFWKRKFRIKSVERLIDEIKIINLNYKKKRFRFLHDLFTYDRSKINEFCDRLLDENINIEWGCSARIDTLDEELIAKMKNSGCNNIFLGIEVGSIRMQKLINKNLKLSEFWEKIVLIKKYGFKECVLSFIYGFPQETINDIRETLNMINKLIIMGFGNIQLHLCAVLAGTELYNIYKNNLTMSNTFSDASGDIDIDGSLDIIEKYPEIFPHFYKIDIENGIDLEDLDKFVSYFYIGLHNILRRTFSLVVEYFNNDLLELFFCIKRYNPYFFKEICSEHKFQYSLKTESDIDIAFLKLNGLKKFFLNNFFGNYTEIIRDMFRFELDITEYLYLKDKKKDIYQYSYDVLKVKKQEINMKEIYLNPTSLLFEKSQSNQLIIKKYKICS